MYLPSPLSPLYHVSFGVAVGDSACVSVFVVLFRVLGCFIFFLCGVFIFVGVVWGIWM